MKLYFKLIGGLKIVSSVRLSVSSQFWKKMASAKMPNSRLQGREPMCDVV